MRKFLLPALLVAALTASGSANAANVAVTYDLDDSTISVLTPDDGDITGTMTIVFESDGLGNILDGPASISSISASIDLGAGALSAFGISGVVSVVLNSAIATVLTGNALDDMTGDFAAVGALNCDPLGLCFTLLALPPVTPVNVPSQSATITGATVDPLAPPSLVLATQSLMLQLGEGDPLPATLNLVGNEIGRVVIPEPGTALLFAAGMAGLGFAGRRKAA